MATYDTSIDNSPITRVMIVGPGGQAGGVNTAYEFVAVTTVATVAAGLSILNALTFMNVNAAPAYLELWDTAAAVTLGVTTPTAIIPIPANATAANGTGTVMTDLNLKITSGTLKIAAVTAPNGNTAVASGLVGTIWAA